LNKLENKLEHGRHGEMSKGQKAETANGGAATAGTSYEVRTCFGTIVLPVVGPNATARGLD